MFAFAFSRRRLTASRTRRLRSRALPSPPACVQKLPRSPSWWPLSCRFLPKPGHDLSLRETHARPSEFTRNTPLDEYSRTQTPDREYRQRENRIVIRRQFGSAMLLLRQSADTVLAKSTTTYDNPR